MFGCQYAPVQDSGISEHYIGTFLNIMHNAFRIVYRVRDTNDHTLDAFLFLEYHWYATLVMILTQLKEYTSYRVSIFGGQYRTTKWILSVAM